jgi:protein phosphatase PTC7
MDLKPLASEGDWTAYLDDDTTGLVYFFNGKTGESVWEPPTDTFPPIKMTKTQERTMKKKRSEYEASLEEKEDGAAAVAAVESKSGSGGFFASLISASASTEESATDTIGDEPIAEQVMTKKGFGAFFASSPSAAPSNAGGIIEEVIADDGAYAGSYKGTSKASSAPAPAPAPTTAPAPAVEGDVASAPAPAKKGGFAITDLFKTKTKVDDIIIPSASPIKIEVASKVLPSPEKASWGGEDAVFAKGRTFGVFDGVSGALKEKGMALYSFTLASQIKGLISDDGLTISEMTDALTTAAEIANMEATGASTATLASIGEDDILRVLTLGDCTVLVYRNGKVAAKTKEILHYFDCPYQLAEDSPDRAKDATKLTFQLQPGDIVVAGSDGIFDNLTPDDIWEQISSVPDRAGMMAGKVINRSRAVSLDTEAPTPYAKQAKKQRYEKYKSGVGGKVDDISCVVVRCS